MRLFIALPLPETARQQLLNLQDRLPIGRPVPEENLHLTLVFLGEQPENSAEDVHDGLDGLRAPAVALSLAGAAVFGGRRGQAIGLQANGGDGLKDLQSRVLSRVRGSGLMAERRRFRPHVTLARTKGSHDASRCLPALAGVHVGPFVCDRFALMLSELHRDGAVYETLVDYPLERPLTPITET